MIGSVALYSKGILVDGGLVEVVQMEVVNHVQVVTCSWLEWRFIMI